MKLQIRYYRDHEVTRMWKAWDERMDVPRWRTHVFAFRFMFCTGSRLQETTRICREDCSEKLVLLKWGKGEGKIGSLGEPKQREVGWPAFFQPYYEEYLQSLPERQRALFPSPRGTYTHRNFKRTHPKFITPRAVELRWDEFCKEIGLRYLPPHDAFRKSFATWMHEYLSRYDMMDQLGHRDYRTTDRIYRGSQADRRFDKPKPEWICVAEAGAKEVQKRLDRGYLKVVR